MQVKALIGELKPLVENVGDATLIVPMIKEYMEIGVKNDEQLIKLATIIQRIESAAAKGETSELFDFDGLQDLLDDSREIDEEVDNISGQETDEQE